MADSYTAPPAVQPTVVAPGTTPVRRSNVSSGNDVCLYFIALFVPPLPVALKRGFGAEFCINILLWIFGWIPGVIHSWYIISKSPGVI
ncbi:hypothetical protein BJ322DRAFT_1106505 [Thelephora terrestris]|uniref:Uncharacterized protein n=1 Tax=Thelephora terrestris TaxID=56493 RepID=A0A9P6HJF8_9AGAM|nr:hypothetical protein BJ322DRAFT_1106505 [Thelephora terrestris]